MRDGAAGPPGTDREGGVAALIHPSRDPSSPVSSVSEAGGRTLSWRRMYSTLNAQLTPETGDISSHNAPWLPRAALIFGTCSMM